MRRGSFVALLLLLVSLACSRGAGTRPSVVLIVMDTTRADRCSINGYERPTTPCLAKLAETATVFTDAWSPAGWTGPAHASLFTGLRPEHHGFDRSIRAYLDEKFRTLAEVFGSAGYATGCFTNNVLISPTFGLSHGFDTFEPCYRDEGRPYPWARETHARAAQWAEQQHAAGKPFFLFVNDMEPHLPYTPSEDVAEAFIRVDATREEVATARAVDYPMNLGHNSGAKPFPPRQFEILSDLYDAEIATLDREIGVLLDRLRASGILDSAVVVVTGDHGENLGDHGLMEHMASLHRTILHVPLVVRIPGTFDRGTRVSDAVRLEDVFPTLIEACGLPPVEGIDGNPLTRDLPGRVARASQASNDTFQGKALVYFPTGDFSAAARGIDSVYDGGMHYIAYSDGREELYDVRSDAAEAHDLATTRPDTLGAMRARLEALK